MSVEVELSKQLLLGEALARWARKNPEKEALVFNDKRYTYSELDERVNRLANGLKNLGVCRNDRVAFMFQNCTEIIECYFACAKLGVIAVPLNFRLTDIEISYQLAHSGAVMLIYPPDYETVIARAIVDLDSVKHLICTGRSNIASAHTYEAIISNSNADAPDEVIDDNDIAAIMYTSGTTGNPKGAALTHKNLIMCGVTFLYHTEIRAGWNVLLVIPLFHMAAFGTYVFNLFSGAKTVISNLTKPEEIMAVIEKEKINSITLVPALWSWITSHPKFGKYDLSSLKICCTGSAAMSIELKKKMAECFPGSHIVEGSGMTETTCTGTFAHSKELFEKLGSCGKPAFCLEMRVIDDNDADVATGEIGELAYRGPTVLKEYYKNPGATSEAFRGGWFHTGDLVRQDKDGYVYIVGRKKEIIISGGENISSEEVEEILLGNPKVMEAAVVGIPDEKWGETVKAYIVMREGESITEEELIDYCKGKLASYKKPNSIEFVPILPRTATGKVQKFKLREQTLSQMAKQS
jgi:acyl-CoA synthetase (AMP-forming)/AMP-acid ligase II